MFRTNPIFFKDLLISLNSKIWKNIIVFFTLIYFIIFLFVLADYKNNTFSSEAWAMIFSAIGTMQLIVLCFIAYIKGLLSISDEKDKNTLEFVMITKITNKQFIIGKFLSIFFYVFLLALISLPFLGIWLILWGVNIQDILLYFLYSASYISVSILAAMFLSSISKNNIFSIIYGVSAIWLFFLIIALIVYNLEYIDIQESWLSNVFGYAVLPVFLFDGIESYKTLNIWGININFIVLHIMLYWLVISFFLKFLCSKIRQYTELSAQAYNYIGTGILFLLFLLLNNISVDGWFIFIYIFLVITYLIYLLSENNFKNNKSKENYVYFGIVMSVSLISIVFLNKFSLLLSLLFISMFFIFFAFYEFLNKFVKQGKGIINLFFIIFISIFFYVIPSISTQLLNIEFKNPSQIMKIIVKKENIINNGCLDNKDNRGYYYNYNCKNKNLNSVYYYIILYIILSLIFLWLWKRLLKETEKPNL